MAGVRRCFFIEPVYGWHGSHAGRYAQFFSLGAGCGACRSFLIAVVAAAVACRKVNYSPLQEIKQQLAADLEVFDTVGGRRERR